MLNKYRLISLDPRKKGDGQREIRIHVVLQRGRESSLLCKKQVRLEKETGKTYRWIGM